MRTLCRLVLVSAHAAAFSTARVPSINFSPSSSSALHHVVSTFSTKKATSTTSLNLSPSTVGGLLLRGGGGAAEAVVMKNFAGDALGFFGGIRIPATFLAGSSLAAIFTLKSAAGKLYSDEEKSKMSRLEIAVVKFYHLVSLSAFVLSLNTIMTATSASTSILHGRFDPLAETVGLTYNQSILQYIFLCSLLLLFFLCFQAYLLLKREFEYEFVSCRFSFLASTFCFIGIVMSRLLIEFELLKGSDEKKKDMAVMVTCSVGALAAHLFSYINQNLYCWNSLIGMAAHFAKVSESSLTSIFHNL